MPSIDVGQLSEAINNKADRDIMNLTNSGYAKGSGLGMPSSRYTDLTLGASGSTYTAPANGWYSLTKVSSTGGQWLEIKVNDIIFYSGVSNNINNITSLTPVLKDDVVTIRYDLGRETIAFAFIYAEGDQ